MYEPKQRVPQALDQSAAAFFGELFYNLAKSLEVPVAVIEVENGTQFGKLVFHTAMILEAAGSN